MVIFRHNIIMLIPQLTHGEMNEALHNLSCSPNIIKEIKSMEDEIDQIGGMYN
jgi:uncharacterized protein Yka (UPF0111/DUF47 family)